MGDAAAAAQALAHRTLISKVTSSPLSIQLGDTASRDYKTWRDALFQRVETIPGASAALLDGATAVALPAAAAMGVTPNMNPAQYLQHHLRALIRISVPAARFWYSGWRYPSVPGARGQLLRGASAARPRHGAQ